MSTNLTTPAQLLRIPTRLGALEVRVHGDGPAAVLWPSMFVDGSTWDLLLPHLPGRRLIVVDGPGLGGSDELTIETDIRGAAGAALDLLAGLREQEVIDAGPVDWIGNAFGGHVGYELAIQPGVLRSFVAISAPVEPIPGALRRQIRMLRPLMRLFGPVGPVRDAVISAMLTDASARDAEIREIVTRSLAKPSRRSLSLALRSFILRRGDVSDRLPRLAVPSLFLAGDDRGDWSPADAARSAALAPDAVAVTIPGSRTLLPLEQPIAVAAALQAFWLRL